ncbi:MAG: response regulator [Erysipelotrichaceae bacterium]|nr:response regulator [Erysipelotrichaceae bacterium]MDY5251170.1 response regulator [Erysipelotrichaceae bacterium]
MKILICDDEKTILNGLKQLIINGQFNFKEILLAEDGLAAIEQIQIHKPEIIITDINMPKLNGLEMIDRILDIVPNSKIIILSGYSDFSYAQKAIDYGVFSYQLKPIKIADLYNIIQNAINVYISNFTNNDNIDPIEYIRKNYQDPNLSLNELSNLTHISISTLSKMIKHKTSMNFSDFLNSLRIQHAKELLSINTNLNILEISLESGYTSQHYFSRVFKNYTGLSPIEYRNKN